ncbi:hypothetical protein QBC39DRAFT_361441 [Podospora conica]|nr:hypothetical protein QBC39DRAFT_361441 [Schizothecium conicum]
MARSNHAKYVATAKKYGYGGQSQTQTKVAKQPRLQELFECFWCSKEKPRDCFSKTALKQADKRCRDCTNYVETVTDKGHFSENGWVQTHSNVNQEATDWNFEEGRKLCPVVTRQDVFVGCQDVFVGSPLPRPASLTRRPSIGAVATLLMAATVTEPAIGKLTFKSLGLAPPKDDTDWDTSTVWEETEDTEDASPRPHHQPILTDEMRQEIEGEGRWAKKGRKTNIVVPQFARGNGGAPALVNGGW